uniref:Putative ABC transport system ATP-binding protein n=1 Tax=Candidatus Kentrum sp. MB TaxID=2138164 RepID=A0A450XDA7_9GAMM|nr:MAG: putative ABC transport system ATP-binding protein [Candidatus Kentron sp. MB]VFK31060.1 MAG: putative ABC transport system ATP-binding protein [Candidatus Kentron sp. MB]VFK75503.1 MAG: putative ABC transport system ATP-binding protein [Candidatus Kentron sp. MB]
MNTTPALYRLHNLVLRKGAPGTMFQLRVLDMAAHVGERVALVGPSGCGKSTLLDILSLIVAPLRAERFHFYPPHGKAIDVVSLSARRDAQNYFARLRRRYIGYVLQTGGLVPFLSIRGNLRAPRRLAGLRDINAGDTLAKRLGLSNHLDKYPADLSVGERQRAAIARALAHEPAVVIADEPTAALDPGNSDRVMSLLVELTESRGTTLLVASHDWDRVERFGFRTLKHRFDSVAPVGETWAEFTD